jgi:MSHA pilin protein MshA
MRLARRGFTIVEVIVVVVAIGLVAALALPHLGNRQREQRIAKLHAARGAVQSAAALMHGVALARHNQPQPACAAAGFGANPPLLNAAGNGNLCTDHSRVQVAWLYPAPTLAGIVASAGLVPVAGTPSASQLAVEGFEVQPGAEGLRVQVNGGKDGARCAFVYRAPAALGQAPAITAAVTDGC